MSYSLRTSGKIERADTHEVDYVTSFDTFSSLSQLQDLELKLEASGTYTVSGITSISEITLIPTSSSPINLIIDAGGGDYTITCNKMIMLRGVTLSSVQVTNPSSSNTVNVRLIVGG
jgi:hypothetical protein